MPGGLTFRGMTMRKALSEAVVAAAEATGAIAQPHVERCCSKAA